MDLKQSFIPKLAFDCLIEIEKSFKSNGSFSDKDLEILHTFFGEYLVLGTELLEKCRIIKYKLQDNLRNIYKIVTKKEQYTIFEQINFCHCNTFRLQVLELRNAVTCKHVLAVQLGIITGQITEEIVTGSQLVDFLNEQLHFIEEKEET